MGMASGIVYTIVYCIIYIVAYWASYTLYYTFLIGKGPWNYEKFFGIVIIISILLVITQAIYTAIFHILGYILVFVGVLYIIRLILLQIWLIGPILLQIPPFPDFEESGLFGLVDRIIGTFSDKGDNVLLACGISIELILIYTKDTIKKVLKALFPSLKVEDSYLDKFFSRAQTDVDENAGDSSTRSEDSQVIKEEKNKRDHNDFYDNSIKAIDIEVNNCITSRTSPIPINLTHLEKVKLQANNEFAKIDCYSTQVEAYIKANLQYLIV